MWCRHRPAGSQDVGRRKAGTRLRVPNQMPIRENGDNRPANYGRTPRRCWMRWTEPRVAIETLDRTVTPSRTTSSPHRVPTQAHRQVQTHEVCGDPSCSHCLPSSLRSQASSLARRWSQTARRLPAKQLEVGSTPTGVSDQPTAGSDYILVDENV